MVPSFLPVGAAIAVLHVGLAAGAVNLDRPYTPHAVVTAFRTAGVPLALLGVDQKPGPFQGGSLIEMKVTDADRLGYDVSVIVLPTIVQAKRWARGDANFAGLPSRIWGISIRAPNVVVEVNAWAHGMLDTGSRRFTLPKAVQRALALLKR